MGTLSRIGLFESEPHPFLKDAKRPTFRKFLSELLKMKTEDLDRPLIGEKIIPERIVTLGYCKEQGAAVRAAKTIVYAHCTSYPFSFHSSCVLVFSRQSNTEMYRFVLHCGTDFWDFTSRKRSRPLAKAHLTLFVFGWKRD